MMGWKRVFGIIWTGQLFSTLSSSIVAYAVIFWLSIETGSAEALALATIAALLPQLLLGPFTGVFVDRWNRRIVMIVSDLFIAACSAVLAIMFYFNEVQTGYIYVLLALRSVGSAFHVPAMQASIPLLAPKSELGRVAGVNQVINSVSTIAGPALAALMITTMDMTHVMAVDIAGAIIACSSLLMVHIPNPEKTVNAAQPHVFREMHDGLKAIFSSKGMIWLFWFVVLANFFIMPIAVMFPLMTIDHFEGSTWQMSIIEIAWGIGMMAGGAALGAKLLKMSEIKLINYSYIIIGLTFGLSGVLSKDVFYIFVALTFLGGIAGAIYHASFTVVMQTTIKAEALGRAFAIYGSATMLPSMIGLLNTGLIADTIGVNNAFIVSGIMIILIGVVSFFIPAINALINKTATIPVHED